MNARLNKMQLDGVIPLENGVWIDCYNQQANTEIAGTILADINSKNLYFITESICMGELQGGVLDKRHEMTRRVYDIDGASPAVRCGGGGGTEIKIADEPTIITRPHGYYKGGEKDVLPSMLNSISWKYNNLVNGIRIRKLTERECFRLMGLQDEEIDKIQAAGISRSQQSKLAGNSIVVNCLAAIFRQLFIGNENKNQQLEIF